MKCLAAALCLCLAATAHETGKKAAKPTKAQRELDRAARKERAIKKTSTYHCCVKPTCNLCARINGSCACARNVAAGKGSCGECYAGWKSGRGSIPGINADSLDVLAATNQSYGAPAPDPEVESLLLQAKKILTGEQRFACCIRAGCGQCAHERNCPCGSDLAAGKGVCGDCLDGWKSGRGAFPGIDPNEVHLAPMDSMPGGMGPGGGGPSSGWYASGTSQEPREAGMPMLSLRKRSWDFMLSGQAFLVYTEQTGERGRSKIFSPNWFMLMVSRTAGPGTLTLRSMLSLEPATVTSRRYPLLFATGETAFGIPIVNGQHPHHLFMELAASYQLKLGERTALTLYGGPRGEPALGPPAFPHRASASENPVAVLAHHLQDSTHVSNNVITAGITHRMFTWEVSGFTGREPGEQRWGLDTGPVDSLSTRLTVTPTTRWSGQFSIGRLNHREITHPARPALRTTASLAYARELSRGRWSNSLIWGRNHDLTYTQLPVALPVQRFAIRPQHFVTIPTRIPGQIYNSYLAESTLKLNRNWIWGRVENTDRDSTVLYEETPLVLLVDEQRIGRVQAYTMGYERELTSSARWLRPGLGAQFTVFHAPPTLAPIFGTTPVGIQVFLKVRVSSR